MNDGQIIRIVVVAVLSLVFESISEAAEELTVISPDGPLPLVVAAEGKIHQDSASDLCDYLSRVSGRSISPGIHGTDAMVTIHVGPDAFVLKHAPEVKDLYADGYVLKHMLVSNRHHIVLSGIRRESSRWVVEEFLKQFCGVRWLFPYDAVNGEIVPSRPTVSLPHGLNQKHEPDYLSRDNGGMYFYDKTQEYLRLRTSSFPFGSHEIQFIFTRGDYDAHPNWFALFTMPDRWADAINNKVYGASDSVIKALARGERRGRWHWDYGNGWQICTSHPETIDHAVAYARQYFANDPDSPIVSMGHNDTTGWCECDLCNKFASSVDPPYSISERYWHWVNQVARELAKTHPDKKVATIAYGAPATPPRFPLEKNVAVTVTVYAQGHIDLVKKWRDKCDSVNLYSYAYGWFFVGFRHYPKAMRDFLKWGHDELGALNHTSEVAGAWSFDGPKYHYMQALMWDVNADPDRLMQEYCQDWFGAAAHPMKAFWDRLEEIYERRGTERRMLFYQWLGWTETHDEFDHYTLDDVRVLDECVAEAQSTANTEPDRFRVARVADAWRYYRALLLGKLKFVDQQEKVLAEASASPDRALELARELADLREQYISYLRQLRAYPHMNPWIAEENYLSIFENVSIFSDMQTLLDALCEQATNQALKTKGKDTAVAFWRETQRDERMFESAHTQIYMIENPTRPNVLANGDFETGDLSGWQISGEVEARAEASRNGRYAAQTKGSLSRNIPVKSGERYQLTVWGKYRIPPEHDAILFNVSIYFQGGGKIRTVEPVYRRLRKLTSPGEWAVLRTAFTVPFNADTAVLTLKSSSPVVFDDLALERIQEAPTIKSGELLDLFSDAQLDKSQWAESPHGRSGYLPIAKDGALLFGDGPNATLVSLSSFDGLLKGSGANRYRLRVHLANSDNQERLASFECGISTGTMPVSYRKHRNGRPYKTAFHDCGFSFKHTFSPFDPFGKSDEDMLHTYWHQDSKEVASGNFDIRLEDDVWHTFGRDVWYTILFDPEQIAIYASRERYDEGDQALVGRYPHKMTNLASQGPVFLKISGKNVKVSEISLTGARSAAATEPDMTEPIDVPVLPR